jgi:chromosomal replication initiation ATPase DnaA
MLQQTLGIFLEPEYTSEDFIVTNSNIEAFRSLSNTHLWPENRMLILGEEGSGKTHLAGIFQYLYSNSLVCENIESIEDEEYLFHLINSSKTMNCSLLLTAATLPRFRLKDLQSRINATHKVLIKPADDYLLRIILSKHFADRQLPVKEEIIDYILSHAGRSYKTIKQTVNSIDKLSLAAKRNITIPLVKSILSGDNPLTKQSGTLL